MNDLRNLTGRIETVCVEPLPLSGTFQDLCHPFAKIPGTVILLSGGDLDCARYNILATLPWLTLTVKGQEVLLTCDGQEHVFHGAPWDILEELMTALRIEGSHLPEPVSAGLFGYLSYDLKDTLEMLPRTSDDDLRLPDMLLFAPAFIVIHDRVTKECRLCISERILADGTTTQPVAQPFLTLARQTSTSTNEFSSDPDSLKLSLEWNEYREAVEKIHAYITSGDVYQVNLARRFTTAFTGDPYALFCALYDRNPAPFFAYIHGGDHHIVSTSPERFLKRTGTKVEARPIKGTRPRGKDEENDRHLRSELQQSPKDDAELSMIVDLLRNDLGKVCRAGSVRVAEHKRVEAYQNVYHLVSRIEGDLEDSKTSIDLIRAAFPGGSITGCPKIRAMGIIDELEPVRRHVYTGAIGYLGFHDTLDLAIAIRTATITKNTLLFSVGGGIVYDSIPQDEYEETRHKGQTVLDVLAAHETCPVPTNRIWMNGKIVPEREATVSVTDPSFQYGYGLFETIRAERGKSLFIADHMHRFNRSWRQLFGTPPPDLTWEDIITSTLRKNRLQEEVAAVKIMAGLRDNRAFPSAPILVVSCRPYRHRLTEKTGQHPLGLNLMTYPHPRQSPLADHKTLNHLYYILAGQWARQQGADEALLLNPDGTISETNSAGMIIIQGRTIQKPWSPHVLPSIMTDKVCALLRKRNYNLEEKSLTHRSLFTADHVLLTNSLMGAVPVMTLDGKPLGKTSRLWIEINDELFQGSTWRKELPIY